MSANNEQRTVELEALQSLVHHPGWEALTRRMQAQADVQLGAMRNATSSDQLLKHTYTYMAITDMIAAPGVLIKTLAQQLQATKK